MYDQQNLKVTCMTVNILECIMILYIQIEMTSLFFTSWHKY